MGQQDSPTFNFSIDLPIRNDWGNVDLVRGSVQNCFTAMFSDIDGCHTLSMITGELLENAVKYGHWGSGSKVFRLQVRGTDGRAEVTVENPVKADNGSKNNSVEELFSTLRWMREFDSPESAYRARLLQIAEGQKHDNESGLGLVRIAYEGDCELDAALDDGTLRVTAALSF